ncbi:hypothetical protein, partial [Actinomadura roseirufa]|uniref:hypothetical protein n=1 Tax=Actinomadura roseirufa TaxID=2094049 RepID=UPI001A954A99
EALGLHAAARDSAAARAELAAWLLGDEVTEKYAAAVAPLVRDAHGRVDALGGHPGFLPGLHGLVDEAAGLLPRPRPVVA